MASTKEEFAAQWRSSAHEAVPYTEDFPECLLVLPELYDGSLNQGNATEIHTEIDLPLSVPGALGTLRIRDNGRGITNLTRLLSWASNTSTDIAHRYGHGSKKMLTKWMRDHETAKWSVQWRTADKRGVSGSLHTLTGPFLGIHTKQEEDGENDTKLMPSGTEWTLSFDPSILGDCRNAEPLFQAIREIICSKYSSTYLDKCTFTLSVCVNGTNVKVEQSSKKWLSFQEQLFKEITEKRAIIIRRQVAAIQGGTWSATEFKLLTEGKANYPLKQNFPRYGPKNMKAARVHIALKGRFIEAIPLYKLAGREANHNDFNGRIVLVNFESTNPGDYECLPTPCTTKVSFYENCPIFKKFQVDFGEFLKSKELEQVKAVEEHVITEADITKMNKIDLETELVKQGLPKKGLKHELQDRLTKHLFPKPKAAKTAAPKPVVAPAIPIVAAPKPVVAIPIAAPKQVIAPVAMPVVKPTAPAKPPLTATVVAELTKTELPSSPLIVELNGYKYHLSLPSNKTVEGLLDHIRIYLK